jgi:cellulose synthase/poly-beta-1,6-N-acetylglucosamine synthase-like glycosyltransferase
MHVLFLIGVCWLMYVYLGYGLLLAVVGLFRGIRLRLQSDYLPKVSVLIAARNEERDIEWKIQETLNWDYPTDRLEVLVASDASDDRTDEILKNIQSERVVVLRMEQRAGKSVALNSLTSWASGEILFFTDANAHVDRSALRRMVKYFADKRVGCVCGQTSPSRQIQHSPLAKGASAYWGYEAIVKRLENQVGSVLVCEGAIFCIRRDLFAPLSPELANDLELPFRIANLGYWICYDHSAFAFEHETSSSREEFMRRRRICAQGVLAMFRLWAGLSFFRAWQFLSRKVLRWFTIVPISIILISSIALSEHLFYRGLLTLQIMFYVLVLIGWLSNAVGRHVQGPVSIPYYIILVSLAGLTGVAEACLGRTFAVWETPTMSRLGSAKYKHKGTQ